MDFVVNSGGKPVKALRGSQNDDVRKKAVALTTHWKALVAGKLERAAAKKEAASKNTGMESEAGELTVIDTLQPVPVGKGLSTAAAHGAKRSLPAAGSSPRRGTQLVSMSGHVSSGRACAGSARLRTRGRRQNVHDGEQHGGKGTRASTARARTACAYCRVLAVTTAAIMLLTNGVDSYSPLPAPHHFFAAGAGSAGQQLSSASKIPAPGQLARPREGVVLKGDGKVAFNFPLTLTASRRSTNELDSGTRCRACNGGTCASFILSGAPA